MGLLMSFCNTGFSVGYPDWWRSWEAPCSAGMVYMDGRQIWGASYTSFINLLFLFWDVNCTTDKPELLFF